ncbi:hypothetical protein [Mesorhizobium sp. Root552]|nr:hypothetical protein [Mesorhizobium sp. Root552]
MTLNIITVCIPLLAFMAGVYFSKWMGDRKRTKRHSSAWYREVK